MVLLRISVWLSVLRATGTNHRSGSEIMRCGYLCLLEVLHGHALVYRHWSNSPCRLCWCTFIAYRHFQVPILIPSKLLASRAPGRKSACLPCAASICCAGQPMLLPRRLLRGQWQLQCAPGVRLHLDTAWYATAPSQQRRTKQNRIPAFKDDRTT